MNCHPLRVLLSISSTLMIKEGNTGEFFSALLVLMVESIMSAVHALFFFFLQSHCCLPGMILMAI